jgi:hypothetical protein
MDFSQALEDLMEGRVVARRSWPGDQYVAAQIPDANSKMSHPYLYVGAVASQARVPWQPTQVDLFASDWFEVRGIQL